MTNDGIIGPVKDFTPLGYDEAEEGGTLDLDITGRDYTNNARYFDLKIV